MLSPLTIRQYRAEDWPSVWPMLQQTFAGGDTYAYPPETTEAEGHRLWVESARDPGGVR